MVLYASDIMRKEFRTISPNLTVLDAARIMTGDSSGFLIIEKDSKPVGIVTEWDIVSKVTAAQIEPKNIMVSDIMSTNFISVPKDTPTDKVVGIMQANKIRRLPVIDNNKIVGVITSRDIIRIFRDYMENIAEVVSRFGNA
jgi:CBS domain-containing protein